MYHGRLVLWINCVLCALNCENKREDVRKIYRSEIKEVDLSSGYERKGRFFFLLEALDLGSCLIGW